MLPKADPGREAWKARSSADESGFQCISAGTSPPGLSTPGWEGTATGGQFKRSIAQGADSSCRICPQGSTSVPAPVSRPVGPAPSLPFFLPHQPDPGNQNLDVPDQSPSARYLPRYVARTPPVPETSDPMLLNICASQVPFESPVLVVLLRAHLYTLPLIHCESFARTGFQVHRRGLTSHSPPFKPCYLGNLHRHRPHRPHRPQSLNVQRARRYFVLRSIVA
ncbi:hypothetical protein BKA56DRAFT_300759 [Ilyonectria sp. MPI-CAGE-AT-0026]|nr:hypothetical protein BKA56DRAFT_300759 [Ilyonectria sp. MPI-CAGE-AT-0026]